MQEEAESKQFDTIAKVESLFEAPVLSKLAAYAFYVDFILRYFYGISLGDFATFASLRDFVIGIKPLSLAFIAAGAALLPRVGFVTWWALQEFLDTPTNYFRQSESDKHYQLAGQGFIMSVHRGKELARLKKDEYLLADCAKAEKSDRKITITKMNVAAIFAITALNLILYSLQPDAGLIMHGLAAQVALLLVAGIYAGVSPPEHYRWVAVPEGYTKEEISPSKYRLADEPPAVKGYQRDERLSPTGGLPE